MLDLQLPWWEFVLRSALIYVVLLVMVRLTGKRTVGQFTPFDLLVVMLLSEAVSDGLKGGDESLLGGLIVAATLVALDMVFSLVTSHSRLMDRAVQGSAVVVGRDGQVFGDVLRRERVPRSDIDRALRAADCELDEMRMAVLEADGNISILKRDSHPG